MDPSLLTGSRPIRAITARHWLSPPSFTPSCAGVPCGRAFPGLPVRGTVGLTTFRLRNMRATRDLSLRRCGVAVSVDPPQKESTVRTSSLEPQLWLVDADDAYESLPMLPLFALTLVPHCPLLADSASPRGSAYHFPAGTFPKASHEGITPNACSGGFGWLNSRSIAGQFTDATSCRT